MHRPEFVDLYQFAILASTLHPQYRRVAGFISFQWFRPLLGNDMQNAIIILFLFDLESCPTYSAKDLRPAVNTTTFSRQEEI
jgi:hypothetical protein